MNIGQIVSARKFELAIEILPGSIMTNNIKLTPKAKKEGSFMYFIYLGTYKKEELTEEKIEQFMNELGWIKNPDIEK